jgi:NADH dehydrogenase
MAGTAPRIVIVGGGYVGMYTALRLRRKLRPRRSARHRASTALVHDVPAVPAGAAAGNVEPRHVVVPLRRVLRGCEVIKGMVTGIDTSRRVVTARLRSGETASWRTTTWWSRPDRRRARCRSRPRRAGASASSASEEAIYLRNHAIDQLDTAATTGDPTVRRRALTFVFVGGWLRRGRGARRDRGHAALRDPLLHRRGASDLRSCSSRRADGSCPRSARTWAATPSSSCATGASRCGCRPGSSRASTDTSCSPTAPSWTPTRSSGRRGSSRTRCWQPPTSRWTRRAASGPPTCGGGPARHWSAGDCAAVPTSPRAPGEFCSPSAQHAVRQAKTLGDNIVAALRGEELTPYKHKYAGSVASLGLHKGVAQIYGVKLRGWPPGSCTARTT